MSDNDQIFEDLESNVRVYCRSFPTVLHRGKNALLYDENNKRYIDFFAGAGALNYGHNPENIKKHLLNFIVQDRVTHALDMYTTAKRDFLKSFQEKILIPRNLNYKIQFTGPTGTNAIEAALKLARLYTKRIPVASFTGDWHGMSTGSLAVTANRENRQAAGIPLCFSYFFPYPFGPKNNPHSIEYITNLFEDSNSGLDLPAAIVVETIQSEGGVYIAPVEWLQQLRTLCDKYQVILIIDDIQVGCGRSGEFFSFERAGIVPDIVCLSKSIGGYGLPLSLVLMKRELDIWKPGQHTGTFRGNQLAMLCGQIAIETYWSNDTLQKSTFRKSELVSSILHNKLSGYDKIGIRGRGLIWGVDLGEEGGPVFAKEVAKACFEKGLILERCGREDTVLKLLPPLTIEEELLEEGCYILTDTLVKMLRQCRL